MKRQIEAIEVKTAEEFAAVKQIRERVFVDEQSIPKELDNDGNDAVAKHVLIKIDGTPLATGRALKTSEKTAVLARISVLPEARGFYLGKRIVLELEDVAARAGATTVSLKPHDYLEKFYRDLGYDTLPGSERVANYRLLHMEKTFSAAPGVLFDMDGTLVQTEQLKAQSHAAAVAHFGGSLPDGFFQQIMGKSSEVVANAYIQTAGLDVTPDEYLRHKNAVYKKLLQQKINLVPGALNLLQTLRKNGYKLALVSSSQRWMMDRVLAKIEIGDFFQTIVSANEVRREKPAPEPYFKAMVDLKLTLGKTCVFEDTDVGLTAAHNAGLRSFGLRHALNQKHDLAQAAQVFDSLEQVDKILELVKDGNE